MPDPIIGEQYLTELRQFADFVGDNLELVMRCLGGEVLMESSSSCARWKTPSKVLILLKSSRSWLSPREDCSPQIPSSWFLLRSTLRRHFSLLMPSMCLILLLPS